MDQRCGVGCIHVLGLGQLLNSRDSRSGSARSGADDELLVRAAPDGFGGPSHDKPLPPVLHNRRQSCDPMAWQAMLDTHHLLLRRDRSHAGSHHLPAACSVRGSAIFLGYSRHHACDLCVLLLLLGYFPEDEPTAVKC